MKTKLILIEGIPGSGKSTFAEKIAEWYHNHDVKVNLFTEGQSHPADLGWNACVTNTEYEKILEKYKSLRNEIEKYAVFEKNMIIIAYTKVRPHHQEFYDYMETFEVYDGRVPDDLFFKLHYNRWQTFGIKKMALNELTIFECAFMQNHVNELLFWRDVNEDGIIAHHNKLLESVKKLSPILIYLSQPNITETINRIAKERIGNNGNWFDKCITYCENSTFGKRRGTKGFDGIMEFFALRKQLELKILSQLSIPYIIIENENYDWDKVWKQIEDYLLSLN